MMLSSVPNMADTRTGVNLKPFYSNLTLGHLASLGAIEPSWLGVPSNLTVCVGRLAVRRRWFFRADAAVWRGQSGMDVNLK